jgi:hypothetical protein
VARCMAFSGKKNRPLVNPMAGPDFHDDLDAAGMSIPTQIPSLFSSPLPKPLAVIPQTLSLACQCTSHSRIRAKTVRSATSSKRYFLIISTAHIRPSFRPDLNPPHPVCLVLWRCVAHDSLCSCSGFPHCCEPPLEWQKV